MDNILQIRRALNKMSSEYEKLKKVHGKKFQVLSMAIVNGILVDKVYINEFDKNGYSIAKQHSELKAYNENSKAKEIILIVSIPPCDQCNKFFKENAKNIKEIYYLCDEFNSNKASAKNAEWVKSLSTILGENELKTHEERLLSDYLKYKESQVVNF